MTSLGTVVVVVVVARGCTEDLCKAPETQKLRKTLTFKPEIPMLGVTFACMENTDID